MTTYCVDINKKKKATEEETQKIRSSGGFEHIPCRLTSLTDETAEKEEQRKKERRGVGGGDHGDDENALIILTMRITITLAVP
jgi:hypothetical protein